jgi:capsule polysaccharide export protein KpsE/RkpR
MNKNKMNTPIVSNKTLLKSYAASIELLERNNACLIAELAAVKEELVEEKLLHKNETANIFMAQVRKLQDDLAAVKAELDQFKSTGGGDEKVM